MTLGNAMLTTMLAYNAATNARLLDLAGALTDEQLDAPTGYGHGSIRATFAHLLGIEWRWRMIAETHDPPVVDPPLPEPATIPALRAFADAEAKAITAWLEGQRDEALLTPVAIVYGGETTHFIPWHALAQYLFHGAQHRSELAAALTALGQNPGDIDFIYYVDPY